MWKIFALGRFPRILRVSLGMSPKALKKFFDGKPEAARPKICLRKHLASFSKISSEPSETFCGRL